MTLTRIIAVVSMVLALSACKFKGNVETKHEEPLSPVIESLKDSGLPCFKCHSYEKYAQNKPGIFSHAKHQTFGVHCNACHIIKEHKESNVNKDACNTCHKLTTFTLATSGMPVNFSHQNHAKKAKCSDCHPGLFLMKKGSTKLTMDEMYKGSSCGACHNGKKAFAATNCARCHAKMTSFNKEVSYPPKTMSAVAFSHELHTAMFKCDDCHTKLFKFKKGGSGMKMDDLYQGKFCGACHNGQSGFSVNDCQRCHK
jgi:c(7)-type cytochrome triheme protein